MHASGKHAAFTAPAIAPASPLCNAAKSVVDSGMGFATKAREGWKMIQRAARC